MRRLAILMLLGDAVGTVIYALLADYSGAHYKTPEARTQFAASIDLSTNILQALLQLSVDSIQPGNFRIGRRQRVV